MVRIENETLTILINEMGAELTSVTGRKAEIEYMWSGDPTFWGKHSPVLFPIVGTLKDNTYRYKGKEYKLPRHGFAREKKFTVSEDGSTFSLSSDEETRKVYPFDFLLNIQYVLNENRLTVNYLVENKGETDMYFSLGAHPAFAVPIGKTGNYEDHFLEFNKEENADKWPITKEGLISSTPEPFLNNQKFIPLTKSLFEKDALVLKGLKSDCVSIRSNKDDNGIDFHFEGFPYFGIWAAKDADFVCLEPWCGIADSETHNQDLETKEGINKLVMGEKFSRSWSIKVF
ncbi:MAG: aldose 1-epimerase family protein [Flavitalea sp.]